MSIRIGNVVYIDGMEPIKVEPNAADNFERIAAQFEVSKHTLEDLISNKPGGVVHVGRRIYR